VSKVTLEFEDSSLLGRDAELLGEMLADVSKECVTLTLKIKSHTKYMKVSQTTHHSGNKKPTDYSPAAPPSSKCGFPNADAIDISRIHTNKNRWYPKPNSAGRKTGHKCKTADVSQPQLAKP
jgi:hypothetical protein